MKTKYPTDPKKPLTPLQAIRKNCLQCLGWDSKEVEKCTGERMCFLYPFRFGKNPNRAKPTENAQPDQTEQTEDEQGEELEQ